MSTPAPAPAIHIPPNHTLHLESTTHILLKPTDAFLNPAQEFNRDISVAVIRTWSEVYAEEKRERWAGKRKRREEKGGVGRKRRRVGEVDLPGAAEAVEDAEPAAEEEEDPQPEQDTPTSSQPANTYRPHRFTLLEAFSATGLRAIRYAKEIPLLRYVVANDLSAAAVESIRRNVEINGLGAEEPALGATGGEGEEAGEGEGVNVGEESAEGEKPTPAPNGTAAPRASLVRVQQGDARLALYAHTTLQNRYDAVDLDPYGTAAPFLDAAVQAISDGGLLCVTCTDMGVLASTNYSEKCFANYGGVGVKAEFCHEAALRLVLHAISTSAARYGRTITPLLSLSIDFYVRIFVRIRTSPLEVKHAASRTGTAYVCSGCQASHVQPLGRHLPDARGSGFKLAQGPPQGMGEHCPECGGRYHLAGPMWIGPLHERAFVQRVLAHVRTEGEGYGTQSRMRGMLTVAAEELEVPFYFTPGALAGLFHCVCPSLIEVVSALLNAGHECTRSHACAGSIKTSASRAEVYDIFRTWIRGHPVNMGKVKEGSPTSKLLAKEPKKEADFTPHPDFHAKFEGIKLVRYTAEKWAPGTRSKM
ncbi:N2,N2-dimethylguanosine tRNA methyltransferase [Calocera viscosa TUFC12733]|uniref:tRNA (guanine(26)-N(2))-dimethyltransferase n=1 Tax=Calocera viscosa (strain TUFC12733) TaxID=1330018 RepID=A0A167LMS7_CALVF|nr:N2,N2-dimethylguanosine tRNA methyltransferase [Calocera viscosa TUFC12733]